MKITGEIRIRRGTATDRAAAIAFLEQRIGLAADATWRGDQLTLASRMVSSDRELLERLRRGDPFTVPDVAE